MTTSLTSSQANPHAKGVRIGFIGLGDMGKPIALRLLRAGFDLVVCDKNPDTHALFVQGNAKVASTPAETASMAEIVFSCLPAPEISEQVAFGPDGVIHGTAIKTYIEISTIGHASMCRIAQAMNEHGIGMLDAPVSGGPRGEANGRMSCFVASDPADFQHAKPVLTAMSDRLFHVGDTPGQSQVLKLANNLLGAANLTVASEMLHMAVRAGINPQVAIDVINVSTGRNRATEEIFESQILNGSFNLGARLDILHKDIVLAVTEAERLETAHSAAQAVQNIWDNAITQNYGKQDLSRIHHFIEDSYIRNKKGNHVD